MCIRDRPRSSHAVEATPPLSAQPLLLDPRPATRSRRGRARCLACAPGPCEGRKQQRGVVGGGKEGDVGVT
eukprot:556791-Rhodomonas_salina.1